MEKEMRADGRIGWIDITKVLGLVIVLMNHAGLVLGPVNFFGGMFYVPVFFVLAGYTYRYRPEVSLAAYGRKKAGRLLAPYFGYNLFLFLFFFVKDSLLGGSVGKASFAPLLGVLYSRSYLYAGTVQGQTPLMTTLNGPTWFLTGLFTALMGYELLMRRTKGDRRRLLAGMAVCLAASWGLSFLPVLLPWSLDTMFLHMILLGTGMLLAREDAIEKLYRKPGSILVLLAVFLVLSVLSGTGNLSVRDYGRFLPFYLGAALSGSVLAMLAARWMERHLGRAAEVLAFMGSHTLGILCLHLFVFMFVQAGYQALGIPASGPFWQAVMIIAAFVVLTPFYKWKRK